MMNSNQWAFLQSSAILKQLFDIPGLSNCINTLRKWVPSLTLLEKGVADTEMETGRATPRNWIGTRNPCERVGLIERTARGVYGTYVHTHTSTAQILSSEKH